MEASTLGVDPAGWELLQSDMSTSPKHPTTPPPGGQRQFHLPTSGALRKVFKRPSQEVWEWKGGTYRSEHLLCARRRVLLRKPAAQRASVPPVGSRCTEKPRDWLKGTEPLSRTTSDACLILIFIPRATLQDWRDTMFPLPSHLVVLGFAEFNTGLCLSM